jgi:MYXO-CTERM domain-containing protein
MGQLAENPFAGARIMTDANRDIDPIIDEAAIWQGTQTVSEVLALFRARYMPKAGSPIIDAGDPADTDSQGRRADIGAIDADGHDQDKLGTFGTPPSELVPPTVSLTAPTSGAELTGKVPLTATATDNAGGSGVVLVQFLVDGATVGQTAMGPYAITFDSATVMNGDHAFAAKAWDAAGNSAVSTTVMATTMNAHVGPSDSGVTSASTGGATSNAGGTATSGGASNGGPANGGATSVTAGGATSIGSDADSGMVASTANGSKSGCGCRVAEHESRGASVGFALALASMLAGRRRKARQRAAR